MYTRKIFGEKLKIKVANKEEFEKIGNWAHKMYMENIMDVDQEFRKILLTDSRSTPKPDWFGWVNSYELIWWFFWGVIYFCNSIVEKL